MEDTKKVEEAKKPWSVSEKEVFESIVYEQYAQMGAKTTVCLLILHTGYEVIGTSAPVNPDNFDFSVGKKLARENAIEKVWEHLGSIVQWRMAVHLKGEEQKRLAAEAAANAESPVTEDDGASEQPAPDMKPLPPLEPEGDKE